jgi:hypothetical protein
MPMVHQLGYTLSWSINANMALRETGEGIDYGCRVSLCGHESSITPLQREFCATLVGAMECVVSILGKV